MIAEDFFDEFYKPQVNHLDSNAGFNGCLFETYGNELEYIFELSKTTKKVWTIIEGDNGELFYSAGFHVVNRLGFLVTERQWETGQEEVLLDCDF